ncbi:MAG: hypothetical protein COC05_05395 [Gammaproteobacteria bacterium]|nr:MAG: hypothetical protein COC05_05395 [Gammaproteobacteria bacterium]
MITWMRGYFNLSINAYIGMDMPAIANPGIFSGKMYDIFLNNMRLGAAKKFIRQRLMRDQTIYNLLAFYDS